MMPQPVLTVWAVPSPDRAAIRAWISATAVTSMRAWLQAAGTAPRTWRDAEHNAGTAHQDAALYRETVTGTALGRPRPALPTGAAVRLR